MTTSIMAEKEKTNI